MVLLFDIEGDSLTPTKIHCMSYNIGGRRKGKVQSTTDYDEMRQLLASAKTLIGHNIIRFDIPVLERLLNVKITGRFIDTLALSWYLYPHLSIHGLEAFGELYGRKKPTITDWENLSTEEYVHRCEEDVWINTYLWEDIREELLEIYGSRAETERFIDYISFKMDCAKEQERSRWRLDVDLAQKCVDELTAKQEELVNAVSAIMPQKEITAIRTYPAKPFKKDGTPSVQGARWHQLLRERGLPYGYTGDLSIVVDTVPGNPNSTDQVKDWLFSLGWEPCTYKYVRDDDGTERQIPQIRRKNADNESELTPSVLRLAETNPAVQRLTELSVIQHRLGIFKSFVNFNDNGWLTASIGGLTNTLRFKHKAPLVNLPGVDKPYGKEIRSCLIAPEGYVLCGSDMVSLEDTTKRHYMYDYDPDYVNEMSRPGFDPHLDLAKFAGVVTQEEIDAWQNKVEGSRELKPIRKNYKVTNYSATYGVRKNKLSRETGLPVSEAQKLLDSFWERNWAILKVVEATVTKTVRGKMWLFNPVSKFWYSLRFEKDIFSTLNQGTGVYCFDMWIQEWRKTRPQLTGQFHDEIIACLKPQFKDRYKQLLKDAIAVVNDKLRLNIKLDVDVQFGETYASIH